MRFSRHCVQASLALVAGCAVVYTWRRMMRQCRAKIQFPDAQFARNDSPQHQPDGPPQQQSAETVPNNDAALPSQSEDDVVESASSASTSSDPQAENEARYRLICDNLQCRIEGFCAYDSDSGLVCPLPMKPVVDAIVSQQRVFVRHNLHLSQEFVALLRGWPKDGILWSLVVVCCHLLCSYEVKNLTVKAALFEVNRIAPPLLLDHDLSEKRRLVRWAISAAQNELASLCAVREALLELIPCSDLSMHLLQHASEHLRCDHEIALAAVARSCSSMRYVPPAAQTRGLLLSALQGQRSPSDADDVLRYAADRYRSDPSVLRAALQLDGLALRYASQKAKASRELVMVAVGHNGMALRYAADELKRDVKVTAAPVVGAMIQWLSSALVRAS